MRSTELLELLLLYRDKKNVIEKSLKREQPGTSTAGEGQSGSGRAPKSGKRGVKRIKTETNEMGFKFDFGTVRSINSSDDFFLFLAHFCSPDATSIIFLGKCKISKTLFS